MSAVVSRQQPCNLTRSQVSIENDLIVASIRPGAVYEELQVEQHTSRSRGRMSAIVVGLYVCSVQILEILEITKA
jgi:hypothetical protein